MYAEASLDEKADLPKKVVIFVDELNKRFLTHAQIISVSGKLSESAAKTHD